MILQIPHVLTADQVSGFRDRLVQGRWADGRITAGYQSARAKHNLQLPESDPVARELAAVVRAALDCSALFPWPALPRQIFPPLFNCYRSGDEFGNHIDNAVRYDRAGCHAGEVGRPVRTDLSATLFLSAPEEYDGGELIIDEFLEPRGFKLAAGDLLLYPATSVHRVQAITRGTRLASFFWLQSLVRDAGQRRILFDLDVSIQKLARDHSDHPTLVELTGVYHNLLRLWGDI